MHFVDTNIVLYAYDASQASRHSIARELVGRLGRERVGALSVQVLQEFYVNAVSKIETRLTPSQTRDRIRVLSRWAVHEPAAADVIAASTISEEHRISFWDAMIVRSARATGCEVLWSEDLTHGQVIEGVRIQNPFTDA